MNIAFQTVYAANLNQLMMKKLVFLKAEGPGFLLLEDLAMQ